MLWNIDRFLPCWKTGFLRFYSDREREWKDILLWNWILTDTHLVYAFENAKKCWRLFGIQFIVPCKVQRIEEQIAQDLCTLGIRFQLQMLDEETRVEPTSLIHLTQNPLVHIPVDTLGITQFIQLFHLSMRYIGPIQWHDKNSFFRKESSYQTTIVGFTAGESCKINPCSILINGDDLQSLTCILQLMNISNSVKDNNFGHLQSTSVAFPR